MFQWGQYASSLFSFFKQAVCLPFQAFSWAATGCRTCHRTAHHFPLHPLKKTKRIMAQNVDSSSIICNTCATAQQGWDETGVTGYLVRRDKGCSRSSRIAFVSTLKEAQSCKHLAEFSALCMHYLGWKTKETPGPDGCRRSRQSLPDVSKTF